APLDRGELPQVHAGAVQGAAHDAAGGKVALAVPVDVRAVGQNLGGRVDKALVALDDLLQQVQGLAGVDGNLHYLLLSVRLSRSRTSLLRHWGPGGRPSRRRAWGRPSRCRGPAPRPLARPARRGRS